MIIQKVRKRIYLIMLIGALLMQGVKGQQYAPYWRPWRQVEKINIFITIDESAEYNNLNSRIKRDSLIQRRLDEDWVNTIPYVFPNYTWVCSDYAMQLTLNSIYLKDSLYYGDQPMFEWYKGYETDSIYKHRGTLADLGKLQIPLWVIDFYDTSSTGYLGHAMNVAITGNSLVKVSDINFIEPQRDKSNVKQGTEIMPTNCEMIMLYYAYVGKDVNYTHENNFEYFPIALYNLKDSVIKFIEINPYLEGILITERDTIPPKTEFDIMNDSVKLKIIDENFKEGHYILDNGTPIPLEEITKIALKDIGAPGTTHKIVSVPKDYFLLTGKDSINVTVPNIDDILPQIDLSSTTDSLKWNIIEDNFDKAWYILNNGTTQTPVEKKGARHKKDLGLQNGNHTLTLYAQDFTNPTVDESMNFDIFIDAILPQIFLSSTTDSLKWDIIEENLKNAWYVLNNGTTQTIVGQKGAVHKKDLGLPNGNHTLTLYAQDFTNPTVDESMNFDIMYTGINGKKTLDNIVLYPNPAKDYINLKIETAKPIKAYVEIYSMDGRLQDNQVLEFYGNTEEKIDLSRLKPNIYMVKVLSADNLKNIKLLKIE